MSIPGVVVGTWVLITSVGSRMFRMLFGVLLFLIFFLGVRSRVDIILLPDEGQNLQVVGLLIGPGEPAGLQS
jgi:uncharacterized membrane protein YfcA